MSTASKYGDCGFPKVHPRSMGSVLRSGICHYCRGRATTEDHIVPRCDLPKPLSRLPYWFRSLFTVPACKPCNNIKDCLRSDCVCEQCTWVWNTARACFLPADYQPRGYVQVCRDRPRWVKAS